MACGVPVMGKVPDIQPEWMNENNGMWVTDKTLMADFVADFIQNWLEDNIKPELQSEGLKTAEQYKNKQEFESTVVNLFDGYLKLRADSFEQQISKTEQ
jgi:glycosyltransferase involved in cell wall biosynthesis